MIAEGRYRGRPVAAALGMAGTGREQIAVQFEFTDPPGQRLTWYGFFTDETFERTVEALRHCGWRGEDLFEFTEGSPLPEGFDQEVELVVRHEEWEGKTNARIAFVNSGGGLALKNALNADEARNFGARMRSKIAALDRAAGRAPGSARTAAQPRGPAARKTAERYAGRAASPGEQVPQEVLDAQEAENTAPRDDVPF